MSSRSPSPKPPRALIPILHRLDALRLQSLERPSPIPYQATALNLLEPIFLSQSLKEASKAMATTLRKLSSLGTISKLCRTHVDEYSLSTEDPYHQLRGLLPSHLQPLFHTHVEPGLAAQDQLEGFLFGFWTTFLDLVSAAPHDSSVQDFAMVFVDELRKRKKVGTVEIAGTFTGHKHGGTYRLWTSLPLLTALIHAKRKHAKPLWECNPTPAANSNSNSIHATVLPFTCWINFNAFCARLTTCHLPRRLSPRFPWLRMAVRAFRVALETEVDFSSGVTNDERVGRRTKVLVAGQWALRATEEVYFACVGYVAPKRATEESKQLVKKGPLYEGDGRDLKLRYNFWVERFEDIAEERYVGEDVPVVAATAAGRMRTVAEEHDPDRRRLRNLEKSYTPAPEEFSE